MQALKLVVRPAAMAAFVAVSIAGSMPVAAADAGGCGQYMYWQNGKCVDARDKPAKGWTESMTSRPAW
jgi:hypothetical protein